MLEALAPGALIMNRSDESNSGLISLAVPDNMNLRDVCSSYDGAIQVFIANTDIRENELIESLSKMKLDRFDLKKIGVLEYSYFDEAPSNRVATVAYIDGPNNIKLVKTGVYDLDIVRQASSRISQYEIGEWA